MINSTERRRGGSEGLPLYIMKAELDKINRYTRRELTGDEVYTFSAVLCDNDIDRDGERFTDEALITLSTLFLGKTGITDHNAASANQNYRIYDCQVLTDDTRLTADGRPYKYLKASAYMVRTEENRSLIAEIEGGIKKEVSISCAAAKRVCSICGTDREKSPCSHIKGKTYGGKVCHVILDDITDAYEWSFVAVPAQRSAGVTKHFTDCADTHSGNAAPDDTHQLIRELRRLAWFTGGKAAVNAMSIACKGKTAGELEELRKSCQRLAAESITPQLTDEDTSAPGNGSYKV